MRWGIRFNIVLWVVSFSLSSWAKEGFFEERDVPIERLHAEDSYSHLTFFRHRQEGGEPILLIHGLMENTRTYREFARRLYLLGQLYPEQTDGGRGFDIWMVNLRGHGRGEDASYPMRRGDHQYTFDYFIPQDYRLIFETIFQATGKKVHVIGRSQGGITATLALAGLTWPEAGWPLPAPRYAPSESHPDGFVYFSPELARFYAEERVASLQTLGSPHQFAELPMLVRSLAFMLYQVSSRYPIGIPGVGPERSTFEPRVPLLPRQVLPWIDSLLVHAMPDGIWRGKNINHDEIEFSRMLAKGLSPVHPALAAGYLKYVTRSRAMAGVGKRRQGFRSLDGRLNFETAIARVALPLEKIRLVAGSHDILAPPHVIWEQARLLARSQGGRPEEVFRMIEETSHVELATGVYAADRVIPVVLSRTHPEMARLYRKEYGFWDRSRPRLCEPYFKPGIFRTRQAFRRRYL